MSGIKAKLHEADASIRKKYAEQQLGGHGLGIKDRMRVARGENVRWEATRASARPNEELGEDYAVGGAGVAHRLPPLPPGMPSPSSSASSGSRPPPPPRGGAAAPRGHAPPPPARTGGAAPPPPARGGAPPPPPANKPRLPPRMNNEAGIDNPPPPYGVATRPSPPARSTSVASSASSGGHIQFSRFTQADKAQFFALLDEYFTAKGADVTPAY